MKSKISPAQRRHQDYLRRKALAIGHTFEVKLINARVKEARRVLKFCAENYDDRTAWPLIIRHEIQEPYLEPWFRGLYSTAGMPHAKSTARDLMKGKDDLPSEWERGIIDYARNRAGEQIVTLTGTYKDTMVDIVRRQLETDPDIGVERFTRQIMKEYTGEYAEWMARRIAQTETMIATGYAGELAAQTLDIPLTKKWCNSGLANTRETHLAMDGVVVGQNEYFELPDCKMLYPHDISTNPPAGEIINCACTCIREPISGKNGSSASDLCPGYTPDAVRGSSYIELTGPAREQRILEMIQEMPSTTPADCRRAIAENNLELEKALGMLKGAPMDMDKANHGFVNPNYEPWTIWDRNCQTCTITYLGRKRGFDMTAKPNTKLDGDLSYYLSKSEHFWEKYFNADGSSVKHVSFMEWAKKLNKDGLMTPEDYFRFYNEHTIDPGIYEVCLTKRDMEGHAVILERFKSGKLRMIDNMTGENVPLTKDHEICTYMRRKNTDPCDGILRIDDKLINVKFAGIFIPKL